jgi:hypothetical protein
MKQLEVRRRRLRVRSKIEIIVDLHRHNYVVDQHISPSCMSLEFEECVSNRASRCGFSGSI